MAPGKLIVIEGNDGSSKRTQQELLCGRLRREGAAVFTADFPQYGKPSAGPVENYLGGKYGSASEVDPRIASVFYAVDRFDALFDAEIRRRLDDGEIGVFNRWVSANMGHQGGKITDPAKRREFIRWVEELEYGVFGLPRPDMTVFLYVPYVIAAEMARNKKRSEYHGRIKGDIHETDMEHMKKAEEAFLEVAKEKGWRKIDCARDGRMLPKEEIHERVWAEVQELLRK